MEGPAEGSGEALLSKEVPAHNSTEHSRSHSRVFTTFTEHPSHMHITPQLSALEGVRALGSQSRVSLCVGIYVCMYVCVSQSGHLC